MRWHCKPVQGCMVYTERAPKRQQLHVAPDMQQPNSVVSTPLGWILKSAIQKVYRHSFKITWNKSAVSLLESAEYRYIKKKYHHKFFCTSFLISCSVNTSTMHSMDSNQYPKRRFWNYRSLISQDKTLGVGTDFYLTICNSATCETWKHIT